MGFEREESTDQRIRGKGATFWVPLAVKHELLTYNALLGL
jgi:hypothetical protein